MKRVLAFDTVTEAEFAAGVLRSRNIACEVRNEGLMLASGPIPFRAEVWVLEDEALPQAQSILESPSPGEGELWTCPTCRIRIEGTFDTCWSCGAPRRERH